MAYDRNPAVAERLQEEGGVPARSLEELVSQMTAPRYVWVMVPSGEPVTQTIAGFYDEVSKMGGGRWDTSSLIRRLRRV